MRKHSPVEAGGSRAKRGTNSRTQCERFYALYYSARCEAKKKAPPPTRGTRLRTLCVCGRFVSGDQSCSLSLLVCAYAPAEGCENTGNQPASELVIKKPLLISVYVAEAGLVLIPARGCQTTRICNRSWPLPPLADVSACPLSVSRVSAPPQQGSSVRYPRQRGVPPLARWDISQRLGSRRPVRDRHARRENDGWTHPAHTIAVPFGTGRGYAGVSGLVGRVGDVAPSVHPVGRFDWLGYPARSQQFYHLLRWLGMVTRLTGSQRLPSPSPLGHPHRAGF